MFLAIILALSFATACGNAEHANAGGSTAQGQDGFVESGAGTTGGGAAGTNGEQITSEASGVGESKSTSEVASTSGSEDSA